MIEPAQTLDAIANSYRCGYEAGMRDSAAAREKEARITLRAAMEEIDAHMKRLHAATIDECAKVARDWFTLPPKHRTKENLFSRIRVLKDKS